MQELELRVIGNDQPCGKSNIQLNGEQLDVEWDGLEAHGSGLLRAFPSSKVSWSIICLYNTTLSQDHFEEEHNVVHLLRLTVQNDDANDVVGFSVSFKQSQPPYFVRFKPRPVSFDFSDEATTYWRKLSRKLTLGTDDPSLSPPSTLLNGQKGLGTSFRTFGESLKAKVGDAFRKLKLCSSKITGSKSTKVADLKDVIGEDELEDTTPTLETSDSTNTVLTHSAAETRSLIEAEEFLPLTNISSQDDPSDRAANYKPLKIFGLSLIILSLLVWIFIRHNDLRRRADRAARREERRTKRLYRRAARQQKIKTWFWNIRLRYRLVSQDVLDSNEKEARAHEQEEILENVAKDDIRTLRRANRVISSITAAEEGLNLYEYEAGTSQRSRASSTLPGYESEGTQPPAYDEAGRTFEVSTHTRSSNFTPAENDSDPDSSVVSTSPRISRDGTNSDFDEKIEALSLEPHSVVNAYQTSRNL